MVDDKNKNKNENNNNFIKASKKPYNNVIKPRILKYVLLFNNNNNNNNNNNKKMKGDLISSTTSSLITFMAEGYFKERKTIENTVWLME